MKLIDVFTDVMSRLVKIEDGIYSRFGVYCCFHYNLYSGGVLKVSLFTRQDEDDDRIIENGNIVVSVGEGVSEDVASSATELIFKELNREVCYE